MASQEDSSTPEPGIAESVFGPGLLRTGVARAIAQRPPAQVTAGIAAAFAALVFIPYLGAVGLWDCWEPHYGEVARMMIERNDYVFPYWEGTWFFSKYPLTMWLQALGMQVVGSNRTDGALALYTEWGMRLPFALYMILGIGLLAFALHRTVGRRAALATSVILVTMPLFFLEARQALTDTPFVASILCAMACALVGQFDGETRQRAAFWYGFYVFSAFALLSKGLLFGTGGLVMLLYGLAAVMPYDSASLTAHGRWLTDAAFRREVKDGKAPMPVLWEQLFRMKLGTGLLVFLGIGVPWFLTLAAFKPQDDEGRRFIERFLYDHFARIGAGVHTTTPGGTFIYFIEQGGYGMFPWVALLPLAFGTISRLQLRGGDRQNDVALVATLWSVVAFSVVAFSATKFHHYVLPTLPPLAVLMGLSVERLWREGIARNAVALLLGLVLFALVGKDLSSNPKNFTDFFVYNYDRPYPTELVTEPMSLLGQRTFFSGDLATVLLLALGLYLAWDAFRRSAPREPSARAVAVLVLGAGAALWIAMANRGRTSPTLLLGFAVLAAGGYLLFAATRKGAAPGLKVPGGVVTALGVFLIVSGARLSPGSDRLVQALMQPMNVKSLLGAAFLVAGGLAAMAVVQRARVLLFGTGLVFSALFALWFSWNHWVDLSHHWTQRDQFWRYFQQRKPNEPIVAFLMNWRGETFYSKNTVKQIRDQSASGRMGEYVALPGRKWALVEHGPRVNILRQIAGPERVVTQIDRELNNKFVLVTID